SCGSIVACCDLVWSIPSKFRSYWTEIYVENEICSLMDWNNQKIYDLLFSNTFGLKRASRGGTMQKIGATDSKTDTFVGVYSISILLLTFVKF
uniref:Uncharacterized protein n=1 Tax=Romanomermis culicivorax TaxID=13658 RepID=A0A915IQ56_ROMCU